MNLQNTYSAGLRLPYATCRLGNELLICDSGNHRVVSVNINNPAEILQTIGFFLKTTNAEGFVNPLGVCAVNSNMVMVADTGNSRIVVYIKSGNQWTFDRAINDANGSFKTLNDICFESVSNSAFFLDAGQKKLFSLDPNNFSFSLLLQDNTWQNPAAVAVGQNFLFVLDKARHKIFRYDNSLNKTSFGVYGKLNSQIRKPQGIAIDDISNKVYISECDNRRISCFDYDGAFIESLELSLGTYRNPQKPSFHASSGKLYLPDSHSNAVYEIDTTSEDNRPYTSHRKLDFQNVAANFRLGLPFKLFNPSSSAIIVESVSSTNGNFFIGNNQLGFPLSISANSEREIFVYYQPQSFGQHTGQLKIDFAQTTIGSIFIDLTGNAVTASAVSFSLVLDKSGSMGEQSGAAGITKLDYLKASIDLFTDLMREDNMDEIGVVEFSTQANELVQLSNINSNVLTNVRNQVTGINAQGSTAIGAGLQLADTSLVVSANQRKVIIVITDGKENRVPLISGYTNNTGAKIFSIGVGMPENIDVDKLVQLSSETNGYFQLTGGNLGRLPKFLMQIISDVFDQQVLLDPEFSLEREAEYKQDFYLSREDMSFQVILNWMDRKSDYEITLFSPGNVKLRPAYFHQAIHRNQHIILTINLSQFRYPTVGKWKVIVTRTKGIKKEKVLLNILVASRVVLSWKVRTLSKLADKKSKGPSGTYVANHVPVYPQLSYPTVKGKINNGDLVDITVALPPFFKTFQFIKGTAEVRFPRESLVKKSKNMLAKLQDINLRKDVVMDEDLHAIRHFSFTKGKSHSMHLRIPVINNHDGVCEIYIKLLAAMNNNEIVMRERKLFFLLESEEEKKKNKNM